MFKFFIQFSILILAFISNGYTWPDSAYSCLSLNGLDSAETLSVEIRSHGCMDENINLKMFFTIGDFGVTAFLRDKDSIGNKTIIGKKELSQNEAAIIDGYLQYLRKPPKKFISTCTATDFIILSWVQWHRKIQNEEFIDGSCFSHFLPISFWKIFDDIDKYCIKNKHKNKKKRKENKITCY